MTISKNKSSNIKRLFSIILAILFFLTGIPADTAEAKINPVKKGTAVTSFISSQVLQNEYVKANIIGKKKDKLKITVRTELPSYLFNVSLYKVSTATEKSRNLDLNIICPSEEILNEDGSSSYGFTYTFNMENLGVEDGNYNLYILRADTPENAESLTFLTNAPLYKSMEIRVKDYIPRILRYKDVMENNQKYWNIASIYPMDSYLDQTIEDINFVLKNPKTGIYSQMTSYKIHFIDTLSNRLCQGLATDMEKAKAIYEYVASNFYYDTIAFKEHSMQFADPYENLYNFENKRTSDNSVLGKVYTTCQGFASMYLCLARAQGIPTRFAYGHHLSIPSNNWNTENNIDVRDHWWAESYIDGQWQFIDCNNATTNKYNKNTGEWQYTGLTNYTYFCPSKEQIATCMMYFDHRPDYRYGKYMYDQEEITKLRAFLNTEGNGQKLNSDYYSLDLGTWGDGSYASFHGSGNGEISHIKWQNKQLSGKVNFDGFTSLQYLYLYNNLLTGLNLSGDTSLKTLYAYNNQITDVNLLNCKSLSTAKLKKNPIKHLTIYLDGANRNYSAGEHGTFSFEKTVKKKITIYSQADEFYKLDGIYSLDNGNKLCSSVKAVLTGKYYNYEIRFVPDPDSYMYDLTIGDNSSEKIKYIQALSVRLKELGYYDNSSYYATSGVGTETYYSQKISDAVKKFQVMNFIENTGNVDENTWRAIFNKNSKVMVTKAEYDEQLIAYEAWKLAMEEQAQAIEEEQSLKVIVTDGAQQYLLEE